jgi:hypothetical protein
MKRSFTISFALLLVTMFATSAQEALDLQPAQREQPARASATPKPSAKTDTTTTPNVPDLSQIDEVFKRTSLGKEADDQRMHVEWRQLANRFASDPEVVAAKTHAESARTDLQKRERLRIYYEIYYGKMRASASNAEIKAALDGVKDAHINALYQPRVRPVPGVSPTITPSHHKKNR